MSKRDAEEPLPDRMKPIPAVEDLLQRAERSFSHLMSGQRTAATTELYDLLTHYGSLDPSQLLVTLGYSRITDEQLAALIEAKTEEAKQKEQKELSHSTTTSTSISPPSSTSSSISSSISFPDEPYDSLRTCHVFCRDSSTHEDDGFNKFLKILKDTSEMTFPAADSVPDELIQGVLSQLKIVYLASQLHGKQVKREATLYPVFDSILKRVCAMCIARLTAVQRRQFKVEHELNVEASYNNVRYSGPIEFVTLYKCIHLHICEMKRDIISEAVTQNVLQLFAAYQANFIRTNQRFPVVGVASNVHDNCFLLYTEDQYGRPLVVKYELISLEGLDGDPLSAPDDYGPQSRFTKLFTKITKLLYIILRGQVDRLSTPPTTPQLEAIQQQEQIVKDLFTKTIPVADLK